MMNFIEKRTVEEANQVNLDEYTFMERLSSQRGFYCFKIREMKRKS